MEQQGVHGAHRESWVHAKSPVGGSNKFSFQESKRQRKSLASVVGWNGKGLPSTLGELFVGFLPSGRSRHVGVWVEFTAFSVANFVQWGQHVLAELGAFLKDTIDYVWSNVLEAFLLIVGRSVENLVENKVALLDASLEGDSSLVRRWDGGIK